MKNETKEVFENHSLEKQQFNVMAVPSNRPFVVSSERMEDFKTEKTSAATYREIFKLAEEFNNNNLSSEGPVLKKVRTSLKK